MFTTIEKIGNPAFVKEQSGIELLRQTRKDLFVCVELKRLGTNEEIYWDALKYLKSHSVNLVLVHNPTTKIAMVVAPEETYYHLGSYEEALAGLIEMANLRHTNHFTRSTVVPGELVKWNEVNDDLREVVDYCIERGAYKPVNGFTAGHFASKVNDHTFLTSCRKTDFNKIEGLVKIEAEGIDKVIAHGAKPSVGGQSQRIIFANHDVNHIVHFHCPPRTTFPSAKQRPYECGSHECGRNTSDNLHDFGNIKAVYLEGHGPNICFKNNPKEVIEFIDTYFDLNSKTGMEYNG